ncbi:hypothetical protein M0R04_09750 [Candidatus Dojkabacteria bacterium]|jgi:membrane protease YdiL (CAAX protease family)|nr:hypothetical protein [Candidatus Dojkabacteria bacterium]
MAKKKRFKKRWASLSAVFLLLLIGVGTFALYNLINEGTIDLLGMIGIENTYIQLGVIILVVIILLSLTGFSFWKSIETLAKG